MNIANIYRLLIKISFLKLLVNKVQTYQDGFKVFHNFIRQNVKDKTTPAEKCGIGINGNR